MDWDNFTFEHTWDSNGLIPNLVSIEAYKQSVLNLVLPPDWRAQLDRLNRVRAVHGTTALEGNPLSEAEVELQLDMAAQHDELVEQRITKEQQQIRNAGFAQDWVRNRFGPDSSEIDVQDILTMHRMITENSDEKHNIPGKFREFLVVVGAPELGGVHKGAPHQDVPQLMDAYIEFVNSRKMRGEHPVIRALLAHFFLVTIHPFGDGNGRVSRLVESGILFQGGYNVYGFYGLSNYFYRNADAYMTTLQECRQALPFNLSSFIKFGLQGFAEELRGINNFIKAKLNRVVYRQTLFKAYNKRIGERRRALNQREYNLLDFLIVQTEPIDPFSDNPSRRIKFSELRESPFIKHAYKDVTDRTFWRELARLSEMHFIKFSRADRQDEPIVELDFGAIGKY